MRFRCRSLSRPSRVSALERIGPHVKTVTFAITHTADTFLPPVIDAETGREQTFVYTPQHHQASPRSPKYGTWEMTDLLVKQYPPLFHAATDVPSFIRVFSSLHNLRHLRVTCVGQPPSHRYRRSVVDYALISLRIAVEQLPLKFFESLSLLSVHPAAVLYLQPNLGFGASPASRKRWSQVRHLTIHMESFPYQAGAPTDHFKLLHAYLQSFTALRTLVFHWKGGRGFSPLSLASEPCLQNASNTRSRQSSRQGGHCLRPLKLSYLQEVELVNAVMDASQVASFILDHRRTLREINFQDVVLRTGSWDEALAPLTRSSGNARWTEMHQHGTSADVPIMLKPVAITQQPVSRAIRPARRQYGGLGRLATELDKAFQGKARSYEAAATVISLAPAVTSRILGGLNKAVVFGRGNLSPAWWSPRKKHVNVHAYRISGDGYGFVGEDSGIHEFESGIEGRSTRLSAYKTSCDTDL